MRTRSMMLYVLGIILIATLGSIPVNQIIERDYTLHYLSNQDNRVEITYGGPQITWVTVECNITTETNFMYPNGTWVGQHNVLLATTVAKIAQYNYLGEHPTIIVEITADQPFTAHITYTYLATVRMNYFERVLYTFGLLS